MPTDGSLVNSKTPTLIYSQGDGVTVVVKVDAGATASPAADATGRVLKGEDLTLLQFAVPFLVCVVLTVAGLWFVSHHLRRTAVK